MMTQVLAQEQNVEAVDAPAPHPACVQGTRGHPLPARTVGTLAAIFAALGEPTRLRIVHALSSGEWRVGELAAALGLAVPAVSQHLRVLRELRIVRNRRVGKMVYYALDDAHIAALFAVALAHVRGG